MKSYYGILQGYERPYLGQNKDDFNLNSSSLAFWDKMGINPSV